MEIHMEFGSTGFMEIHSCNSGPRLLWALEVDTWLPGLEYIRQQQCSFVFLSVQYFPHSSRHMTWKACCQSCWLPFQLFWGMLFEVSSAVTHTVGKYLVRLFLTHLNLKQEEKVLAAEIHQDQSSELICKIPQDMKNEWRLVFSIFLPRQHGYV